MANIASAPLTINPAISYNMINLRPYNQPVATAITREYAPLSPADPSRWSNLQCHLCCHCNHGEFNVSTHNVST